MKNEVAKRIKRLNKANQKRIAIMEKLFWSNYEKAIAKAKNICNDREGIYIGEVLSQSIMDIYINGEDDIKYEINKKVTRLRSLIEVERKGISPKTTDSIEDTLIDLLNYAAFHYAFRKTVEEMEVNKK